MRSYKCLYLFFIVFGTINALSAPPDLSANEPQLNPLPPKRTVQYGSYGDPPHNPSDPSISPLLRSRRNAKDDPLQTSVEWMQVIARITNAISLQEGLKDGTLIPEEVVAELLHFGSVTSDQIKKIDANELEAVFDSVKYIPSNLTNDENIEKAESVLLTLLRIKQEYDGAIGIEEWAFKESLKNDLMSVEKYVLNSTVMDEILSANNRIDVMKNFIVGANNTLFKHFFDILKDSLDDFVSNSAVLLNELNEIVMFPSNKTVNESFYDISKLSNVMNNMYYLREALQYSYDVQTEYNAKVASILNSSIIANTILPQLKTIDAVLRSRETPDSQRKLDKTNGFPKGDIWSLFDDFSNKWLKELTDTKSLSKSLSSFVYFGDIVQSINNGIGEKPVTDVFGYANSLIMIGSISDKSKQASEELKTCYNFRYFISEKVTYLDLITGKLKKINTMKQVIREIINNVTREDAAEMIKYVHDIATRASSSDDALLKELADDVAGYGKIKEFETFFVNVTKMLRKLNITELKNLAQEVLSEYTKINDFELKLKLYEPFLKCLQNVTNSQYITEYINKTRELQKYTSLEKEMNEELHVLKALQEIKNARMTVEKMKIMTSHESAAFESLIDPIRRHMNIGPATRIIQSMKNAIDQKTDFEMVKSKVVDEVLKKKGKVTGEDNENLQKLVELEKKLKTMSSELETWKNGIKKLESMKLEDYSEIFLKARKVSGIDEDLNMMSDWVGKLAENEGDMTMKKDLEDLSGALSRLHSIGLNFSDKDKSLTDIDKTLKDLDTFFVEYSKKLAAQNNIAAPAKCPQIPQCPQFNKQALVQPTCDCQTDTVDQLNEIGITRAHLLVFIFTSLLLI